MQIGHGTLLSETINGVQRVRFARNTEMIGPRRFLIDIVAGALESKDSQGMLPQLDLLLIDGTLNPADTEVVRILRDARQLGKCIIALCVQPSTLCAAAWVEIGVHAVLTDDATLDELILTAERLSRGETVLGVAVREGMLTQLRRSRQDHSDRAVMFLALTRREREVLNMLANGASPEDVARNSFVSLNTVRTQIRGILAKLDVTSVVAAVALAYRSGWIQANETS